MAYQVIARKWRPQVFEDLVGQEILARTLQNSITAGRLHHAYLFHGTRGVGKTTTARILAKAVNCKSSSTPVPKPCNICDSCKEIATGKSMDVIEVDAASNTGVENVKDIIVSNIGLSPARDRYRIFIIDEVHMLSDASFNALLKTIEEPPPRRLFILATTELHKVPKTITSRSQVFNFSAIPTPKIAQNLTQIALAEKIEIAPEGILLIARSGEGSMRDAQSALDQVISFVGTKITSADVEQALGFVGSEFLVKVMGAISGEDAAEGFAFVDSLVSRGFDLRVFCRDLLGYIRDLTVVKSTNSTDLVESPVTSEILAAQAKLFSQEDLVRFFNSLSETEMSLKTANNPRYILEIGLIKLLEMRKLVPITDILTRLNKMIPAETK